MRADRPSATAEAGLAMRALESARPAHSRLFADEDAKHFLRAHHRVLIALCAVPAVQRSVEWVCDRVYPGAPADFICRTRFIDDAVARAVGDGVRRVVIVGAGYDTRSFHLARRPELEIVDIVEIDHPDTQRAKVSRARRVVDAILLGRVRFVAHDLATGPPPELPASTAPTAFVVEGLTGYLTGAAVDALFTWMRRVSASGSTVVFTYADRRFLDGRCTGRPARTLARYLERVGEPFLTGWYPEALSAYCAAHGFTVVEDHDYPALARQYLTPRRRRLHTYEFGHVAVARRL